MNWFPEYVPVSERKRQAAKEAEKLKKSGKPCEPVVIEGKKIAHTFWGKAWCEHMEKYSDYANRLPRGRSYVRNGSVIDLNIGKGEIIALVSGSSIYTVKITIAQVIQSKWKKIVQECAGKIESLIELLQGKFSTAVMKVITDPKEGLFPNPKEIQFDCSCPDWADMCKHVAAVLYGIGARLDHQPEALFTLRQADHLALISTASTAQLTKPSIDQKDEQILKDSDLSSLFGIDMEEKPQKKSAQPSNTKNIVKRAIFTPKIKAMIIKKKNNR